MTTKEHNDEIVRRLAERNKIAEFAMKELGMDERRAEVFTKACGDRFVWDGASGLQFKGASGLVASNDPQCVGFFTREYDFLLPPKAAGVEHGELDPNLIEQAKAGNQTARGRLWRELHGDKPRSAEAETTAALDKLLKGETPAAKKAADKSPPTHTGDNPWRADQWNVTAQGKKIKEIGDKAAAGLAKSAGSYIGATKPTRAA